MTSPYVRATAATHLSLIRRCQAFEVGNRLYKAEQWRDIRSFAVVKRTRTVGERTTVERQHYICSLAADAEKIAHAVRIHWEVENRLHWCLDVVTDRHIGAI